jgi:hypothetical protein
MISVTNCDSGDAIFPGGQILSHQEDLLYRSPHPLASDCCKDDQQQTEVEVRNSENCLANELQAGWGAMGSQEPPGQYDSELYMCQNFI